MLQIGRHSTKLCVDNVGLLFWPTLYIVTLNSNNNLKILCILFILLTSVNSTSCGSCEHSSHVWRPLFTEPLLRLLPTVDSHI